MDALDLEGMELEEIERRFGGYNFPAITVGESAMTFNSVFSTYLKDVDCVTFGCNSEYVVFRPVAKGTKNSFALSVAGGVLKQCVIPAALREKKIRRGVYKAYRTKDGFAFKRYEPLDVWRSAK